MLNTYKTILVNKKQLTSDVYLFTFKLIDPPGLNFIPGQYLIMKVPKNKELVSRAYSIASSNTIRDSFQLIIEIVPQGLASNYLINLKENDQAVFQGPAGQFQLRKNNKEKIFLVTGTGIAPILSMIKSNFQFSIFNYQLFWGLKNYKDVYLFDELKSSFTKATEDKQFNLKICLSREQNLDMIPEPDRKYFELGHIDVVFNKQFNNEAMKQWSNFEFYLCGRREIVDSLKNFLISKNIPQENIVFEKF